MQPFQGHLDSSFLITLKGGAERGKGSLSVTVRLINILDSQLDLTVISLSASHRTGSVCRTKSIPQLFHVSAGRTEL